MAVFFGLTMAHLVVSKVVSCGSIAGLDILVAGDFIHVPLFFQDIALKVAVLPLGYAWLQLYGVWLECVPQGFVC